MASFFILSTLNPLTYEHPQLQNFFSGLYPRTPVKKGGERGREREGAREGRPPIYISGYAAASLVVEVPSINFLKMRLDKFWSNQDVLYNFKAPFFGTGSISYA